MGGMEKAGWKILPTISRRRSREVGVGGTTTKAQVVALVASPVCAVKSYSIDRLALTTFDANTALLIYHAAQDTTCKGIAVPSPVWATSLYIRRDGRWFNVLYQQTPTSKMRSPYRI